MGGERSVAPKLLQRSELHHISCKNPVIVAVRKKLQKIGGASLGFVVSRDMLEHLGITGDDRAVVVEALPGGALLIQRDGAPAPSPDELHAELTSEPDVVPTEAPLKEWRQRLLLAVRDHGPINTTELARIVGRTRESTSGNLNKLKREGLVHRSLAGWELTPAAARWFENAGPLAELSSRDRRFAEALRELGPSTPRDVARRLGVGANYASRVLVGGARNGWAVKRGGRYELA